MPGDPNGGHDRSAIAKLLDAQIPDDALDYEGLDALTTAVAALVEEGKHAGSGSQPSAAELTQALQKASLGATTETGFTRVPPSEYRLRPVNPHDAEEQLRPYLGRVLDADAALEGTLAHTPRHETALLDALDCYAEALDKALELLQVQR